jgi:hypothetical protein
MGPCMAEGPFRSWQPLSRSFRIERETSQPSHRTSTPRGERERDGERERERERESEREREREYHDI